MHIPRTIELCRDMANIFRMPVKIDDLKSEYTTVKYGPIMHTIKTARLRAS